MALKQSMFKITGRPRDKRHHVFFNGQNTTILREPVERCLSVLRKFGLERAPVIQRYRKHNDLEGILTTMEFNNGLVRRLSGCGFKPPASNDLEQAKRNLDGMSVFGLTEKLDELSHRIEKAFGLKLEIRQFNQSKPEKFEPWVMEELSERNKLDIDLYEYAKQRY